jgi:glutaminyl-tRNA synthetase
VKQALIEPNWKTDGPVTWSDGCERVQFERIGYFCIDEDSTDQNLVWNRTVTLKDSWSKK